METRRPADAAADVGATGPRPSTRSSSLLSVHGRDWVKVAYAVGSRTLAQVRSHAQALPQTKERRTRRAGPATPRARRSSRGPSQPGRRRPGAAAPTATDGDAERARGGLLAPRGRRRPCRSGAAAAAPGGGRRRLGRRRARAESGARAPPTTNSKPRLCVEARRRALGSRLRCAG